MDRRKAILLGATGTLGMLAFKNREQEHITNNAEQNNQPTMKTIGILGGLGPQATVDLEARIHRVSQSLIPQHQNTGYPPMVVFHHPYVPVVLKDDGSPVVPFQPDPRLLETAKRLGSMADFIIMASNGIHVFQKEIEQAAGKKMLSMIDVTLDEVKKRKWQKVGVLAFKSTRLYAGRLSELNIAVETIDEQMSAALDRSIVRVMEGSDNADDRKVALDAIKALRARNVDGIIPGCTELPFLLEEHMKDADLLNPLHILADAAVRLSLAG